MLCGFEMLSAEIVQHMCALQSTQKATQKSNVHQSAWPIQ